MQVSILTKFDQQTYASAPSVTSVKWLTRKLNKMNTVSFETDPDRFIAYQIYTSG